MLYRREIDGLRAFAVLPVIFFHAGFETFSGGFVGVDVFFVISGYLITTILLQEFEQEKFSIVGFYERRARRILPALFLVMLVCLPFAWFWLLPGDMKDFSQSLAAVALFSSNILFWSEVDYFDTAAELKPLLHTWSLAVEEQYYVLFPLFLMAVWRFGKKWILPLMAIVGTASLVLAELSSVTNPSAAFYLLPTRGWELLIGGLTALWLTAKAPPRLSLRFQELLSWVGLTLLIYAVFAYTRETTFPSLHTLAPTLGTALIILFASSETHVGRILSIKPLVDVGLISYSAYLWHQPLFSFARHLSLGEPSGMILTTLAVLSLLLAYVSWSYVENPFRSRAKISRKTVFLLALFFSIFFVIIGAIGHRTGGFSSRVPRVEGADLPRVNNGWCFYSIDSMRGLSYGADALNCFLGDKESNVKAILFGDSHAGQYEPLWDKVGREAKISIHSVTTNWCYPALGEGFTGPPSSRAFKQCLFNRSYLKSNLKDYEIAVFAGAWGDVQEKGKIEDSLRLIEYAASIVDLVIVMPSPKAFDSSPLKQYQRSLMHGYEFDITKIPFARDKKNLVANEAIKRFAGNFENVLFVERDALFNVDGKPAAITSSGVPFSLDGRHISILGSQAAASAFVRSHHFKLLNDYVGKRLTHQ